MSVAVFFSYAHKDEDFRDELTKHLKGLERQGTIRTWSDRNIDAGTERATEIDEQLNTADIILLLISADFVASDYCYDIELKRAVERHEKGEAVVIPILLRPVDWEGTPFMKLQALPQGEKPITEWENQDKAFRNIAQGIRRSIQELNKVGQKKQARLYRSLLKLGYQQQARLFRRAIESESVAAFLIHGLPEYGQRWLLNRLVVRHLPEHLNSKVVKVNLGRLVRQTNVSALWRELGGRVRSQGHRLSPAEIAEGVYRWWLTQDVILVFHDAHLVPESALRELIEQFWLPLIQKVQTSATGAEPSKLLMFLVDYMGKAEHWNLPVVEKLDASWKPQNPIRPPRIQEFTENELITWLENQYVDLPSDLTSGIDEKVEEILASSEGGIPELALREICDHCGLNWYEELDKWLRL